MRNYDKHAWVMAMVFALSQSSALAAWFQGAGAAPPPISAIFPLGISSDYVMVGGSGGTNWIWADGVYRTVSEVPAAFTDISNDGSTIIGGYVLPPENGFYKIVNGVSQFISPLSQEDSIFAKSVSADGSKIVGGTRNDVAWVYTNGGYITLTIPDGYSHSDARAISSDGSIIAGRISGADVSHAVVWSHNEVQILSSPANIDHAMPQEISGDGSTIVGYYSIGDAQQACLWRDGAVETLPMPAGTTYSIATAVSFDGSFVFGMSNGSYGAFVWDEINGTRSLKDFFEQDYGLDLMGWDLRGVGATDASGNIISGYGINPQGQRELWIATIPEPATLAMLGFGGLLMRRKK